MNILSLDTATSHTSLAITVAGSPCAELSFVCQRSLSSRITVETNHLLTMAGMQLQDINLFAVGVGPGSFTGVRCGIATIQGLGLATGKPCVGFSSLKALAGNVTNDLPVCTLFDARKNEVYGALYNCSNGTPQPLMAEAVLPVSCLLEKVCAVTDAPLIFLGDGATRYQNEIITLMGERARFVLPLNNQIHAAAGAVLAEATYQKHGSTPLPVLLPHYIRPSDAELARTGTTPTTPLQPA